MASKVSNYVKARVTKLFQRRTSGLRGRRRGTGACLSPPSAVLRLGKGTLDGATQYGQEPMRFLVVMILEGCYGPDQRAMHLLQSPCGRLLHWALIQPWMLFGSDPAHTRHRQGCLPHVGRSAYQAAWYPKARLTPRQGIQPDCSAGGRLAE
jgi:hypothetical protein